MADQSGEASRFEQRQLYKKLIGYIKSNQRTKFNAAKDQLAGYPLYPYLDYTDKIHHISRQTPESINKFVTQYRDTPLAEQLTQNWLYSLARRGDWQTFVDHYDPNESNTSENACSYAYGLYKTGATEAAFEAAQQLWLVNYSQPDTCDSIFKVWQDDGGLTPDFAWQRFELALTSGKTSLANYLVRFLSREDKALADQFLQVHKKPQLLNSVKKFSSKDPKTQTIITHGLKRLARRSPEQALKNLKAFEAMHGFDQALLTDLYTSIAIKLARDPDLVDLLESIPVDLTQNQDLVEAQLLTNLKQLQWSNTLVFLNLLDEENQSTARWTYWKARILSGSTDEEDREVAEQLFRKLAGERSFYGFMAADRMAMPYNYQDAPKTISREQLLSLESTPGIQRALELFALNEKSRARREWNFTTQRFSVVELQIAARVAQKWGWHAQAIRSMIAAKAWDDLSPRFPLAYQDNFLAGARTEDIPVTWSLAIARQESAFMADAKSSAGALGIMQLMPSTAKSTASSKGIRMNSTLELIDPQFNIKLGSAYLGKMLRRFDQNRIIASAAYNAGPNRVNRWIDNSIPVDVWVETIPFNETRNYVQNVLMFSAIYGRKLNQPAPLFYENEVKAFSNTQITATSSNPASSS